MIFRMMMMVQTMTTRTERKGKTNTSEVSTVLNTSLLFLYILHTCTIRPNRQNAETSGI